MRPTGGSVVSTQACTRLPKFQHQVLMGFCERLSKKGHSLRGPGSIAVSLGCSEQEIRDVLPDLDGFVELDAETGRWTIHDKCVCQSKGLVKNLLAGSLDAGLEPGTRLRRTPIFDGRVRGEDEYSTPPLTSEASDMGWGSLRGKGPATQAKPPKSGRDLSFYFLASAPAELRVGANRAALSGNFTRWLREGIEPAVIARMIDIFLANPGTIRTNAWRKFLHQRNGLLDRAKEQAKADEARSHRYDPEYWTGRHGAC